MDALDELVPSRDAKSTIRALFEATAGVEDEQFIRVLVTRLAITLSVPYVWVSECLDSPVSEPLRVRTLAFWVGHQLGPDAEYAVSGTPCEGVFENGDCRLYRQDLVYLFPGDTWLREIGVESYMGVPLLAASGRILGHLAVMDRKPLAEPSSMMAVLQEAAGWAAAKLERRQR